jgi:hypothetical protein
MTFCGMGYKLFETNIDIFMFRCLQRAVINQRKRVTVIQVHNCSLKTFY